MYTLKPKENEGLHIEGDGVSIDLIIVARGGHRYGGEACVEVIGLEGVDKMCLGPSEELVHLGNDIYIGVLRREREGKPTNEEVMRKIKYYGGVSERIEITYDIPRNFRCEFRRYA